MAKVSAATSPSDVEESMDQSAEATAEAAREAVEDQAGDQQQGAVHAQQAQASASSAATFRALVSTDEDIRSALTAIQGKPNLPLFFGYAAAWIIVIWLFRAWRLQKVHTALTRIWTQAWIAPISILGMVLLIPLLAWGSSYRLILSSLLKDFLHAYIG